MKTDDYNFFSLKKTFRYLSFLMIFLMATLTMKGQNLKPENFSLSQIDAKIKINKTPLRNSDTIQLSQSKTITGLSVDATVSLNSDRGFVRIILVDKEYKEYQVFETNFLMTSGKSFSVNNVCDETFKLSNVIPLFLRIELEDATISISAVNITYGSMLKSTAVQQKTADVKAAQLKDKIAQLNLQIKQKKQLWVAGETSVSKLSYSEKKAIFGGKLPNLYGFEYYVGGIFVIPSSDGASNAATNNSIAQAGATSAYVPEFSWKSRHGKNWVSPVTNQGGCGSCWAFSTVGTTELLVNIYYNQLLNLDLSEQDVLSCSGAGTCAGGYPGSALNYAQYTGIVNESCFPYAEYDKACNLKCISPVEKIQIGGYKSFDYSSEDTLKKWSIQGPVSLGISPWSHSLTMVGYKTLKKGDKVYIKSSGQDTWFNVDSASSLVGRTAWQLKNSWGTTWGDMGFGYVVTNLSDMYLTYQVLGPITSYATHVVQCTDNDGDGYYCWGVGPKPSNCPTSPAQEDGDDSNPEIIGLDAFGNYIYSLKTPTSLIATAIAQNQIFLSWADNSKTETGYTIELKTGSGSFTQIATVDANVRKFGSTGLTPNTSYSFRVKAINGTTSSSYSNTATIATQPTPGTVVTNPTVLAGSVVSSHQINLTWADNSGNETGFCIERATGTGSFAGVGIVGSNITSFSDTALTANTTYSYRVFAFRADGHSGNTNTVSLTTTGQLPAAPTAMIAKGVNRYRVIMNWNDNADNETGFIVEKSTDGTTFTQIALLDMNTTYYEEAPGDNQPLTTYYYRVRSFNAAGNSAYSNVATAKTTQDWPLGPTNLSATAVSETQVNLTWTDNASNEDGFIVFRYRSGDYAMEDIAHLPANSVSYSDYNLLPNNTYIYQVYVFNDADASGACYSNKDTVTTSVGHEIICYKTVSNIVVDGNLNEGTWSLNEGVTKDDMGTRNNTITYGVLYDNANLYIGVKVLDANVYANNTSYSWENDGIELYFDPNNSGGNSYDSNDRQYVKSAGSLALWANAGGTTGTSVKKVNIPGGYSMEFKIPFSLLGISGTPSDNMTIGFDIANNDDDTGNGRSIQTFWNGDATDYNNPSKFGKLRFSSTVKNGEVICYKSANTITVNGTLNETSWTINNPLTNTTMGTRNNTTTFGVLYDNSNLYVGVKVLDANIFANNTTSPWENDGIELYFDPNNSGGTSYDSNDRQYIKATSSVALWANAGGTTGASVQKATISGGYTMEFKIPFTLLGISSTPADNTILGFDIANNDDDNGSGRTIQTIWNGDATDFTNPSKFGKLRISSIVKDANESGEPIENNPYSMSDKLLIYPNPGDGTSLNMSGLNGKSEVKILTINGSLVYTDVVYATGPVVINSLSLSPGVYIIKVQDEISSYVHKLIVR